jgi:heme/copper-type cytochrome/quinol oxidase subunit 3
MHAVQLGVLLFIGSEIMLFAGLLAVYTAFRFGNLTWPSAQLYLPVKVTWVNTFFLLSSCYTMYRAVSAGKKDQQGPLVTSLTVTALLGTLFVSIQGYEWIQLIRVGFTITTGVYGATFYLLIGCHALHVLGAVIWLLVVVWLARQGRFPSHRFVGVEVCAWYWYFVGGLWVLLFALVYLN